MLLVVCCLMCVSCVFSRCYLFVGVGVGRLCAVLFVLFVCCCCRLLCGDLSCMCVFNVVVVCWCLFVVGFAHC